MIPMTKYVQDLLEMLLDQLREPLRNDLEVGFRHSPLSNKEIIERYEATCNEAFMLAQELEKELNKPVDITS